GDFELTSTANMFIDIAGTGSGEFDVFDIVGDATIAGGLAVDLLNGFQLDQNQQFLFTNIGGNASGTFDGFGEGSVVFFDPGSGMDLFISYVGGNGNDIVLYTQTVPEPTTLLPLSLVIGGISLRRRRKRNVGR
ncbi:hypothetical protein MNBD_ALPHA05-422, partial [hydrothermal vent metagenome]